MSERKSVVDSSGWIEVFTDGPLADRFLDVLAAEDWLVVPAISILEVFKWVLREHSEAQAIQAAAAMQREIAAGHDASRSEVSSITPGGQSPFSRKSFPGPADRRRRSTVLVSFKVNSYQSVSRSSPAAQKVPATTMPGSSGTNAGGAWSQPALSDAPHGSSSASVAPSGWQVPAPQPTHRTRARCAQKSSQRSEQQKGSSAQTAPQQPASLQNGWSPATQQDCVPVPHAGSTGAVSITSDPVPADEASKPPTTMRYVVPPTASIVTELVKPAHPAPSSLHATTSAAVPVRQDRSTASRVLKFAAPQVEMRNRPFVVGG